MDPTAKQFEEEVLEELRGAIMRNDNDGIADIMQQWQERGYSPKDLPEGLKYYLDIDRGGSATEQDDEED